MNPYYPYQMPFYPMAMASKATPPEPVESTANLSLTGEKTTNTTHFVMGMAAGAAVAYLLTNKAFQQGLLATGSKAWSSVRGEVEELKERLEDTQAELEYYRNLHQSE